LQLNFVFDSCRGNSAGGVDVAPESGIDAIVSHVLEEVGQHILRVEVGYGSGDGNKTLRKFYRFSVTPPILFSPFLFRTGDSSCFISITLENNGAETKGGLTICSAEFDPAPGLRAKKVKSQYRKNNKFSSVELFDECGRLEPGASKRYLFKVTALSQTVKSTGIAAGDELGKAVFTWYKACGEMGRMTTVPLICPNVDPVLDVKDPEAIMEGRGNPFVVFVQGSALSVDVASAAASRLTNPKSEPTSLDQLLPVTVEPVEPPRNVQLGKPFCVNFLVVNHSEKYMTIQLQFRLEHMNGLSVCGPSFKNLDEVPGNGGSVSVSIRFMALTAGLLQLRGCCVADLATGLTIPQPPLFSALVR
jgi:hypothetical protein